MQKLTLLFIALIVVSCSTKEQVDLIVTNANVYTVNESFDNVQAFAVKDGKFIEERKEFTFTHPNFPNQDRGSMTMETKIIPMSDARTDPVGDG